MHLKNVPSLLFSGIITQKLLLHSCKLGTRPYLLKDHGISGSLYSICQILDNVLLLGSVTTYGHSLSNLASVQQMLPSCCVRSAFLDQTVYKDFWKAYFCCKKLHKINFMYVESNCTNTFPSASLATSVSAGNITDTTFSFGTMLNHTCNCGSVFSNTTTDVVPIRSISTVKCYGNLGWIPRTIPNCIAGTV
jgi:hypothetical protein